MNPFECSQSNDRRQLITDVGIFVLPFGFPFSLRLPLGAIAVSIQRIYSQGVSITIQLHVDGGSQEGTYNIELVVGCVFESEALICASNVKSS